MWPRSDSWSSILLLAAAGAFLLIALLGPLLWHQSATDTSLLARLKPPSLAHPFGTDQYGRDILARFLAGARLSALFGAVTVLSAAMIGTFTGVVCGVAGGVTDAIISRILDAILSFPALILAMAIAIAAKPSPSAAGVAVIVVAIPWYARRVRSEVLSLKSRPYIEAAKIMGASPARIVFKYLLPSVLGGVVAQASLGIGYAILTLTALGFIGLGVQPPTSEWGSMITEGRRYLLAGQWWLSIFPGLGVVTLVALSFAIGNSLSDRLGEADQRR